MAAYVQGTYFDDGTSTQVVSVTLNGVTAGNTLILLILSGGSGTTVSSVSDGVNTWSRVVNRTFITGAGGSEVWVAYNVASGNTTVTSSLSASGVSHKLLLHEVSGLATNGFDKSSAASGTSSTPSSGATATTTQASEYVFGFVSQASGSAGVTEDAAFTLRQNDTGALSTQAMHSADRIVSSTGAYTYAPTLGSSKNWVCIVATFKAATTTTYNDSIALGSGLATTDTAAATIAASLALGAAGGTSDGATVTVAAAVAAGIAQAFAATNGSVYASSIGLGTAAATSAGATLGLSLSAALAAQYGVSVTPAATVQAATALGAALATNPQAVLSVLSQMGVGIGVGVISQGGLVFADHIALGAFAQAVAQQVAGVVAVIGRAILSDAPVFSATVSDSLAGNATVSDSPAGGAQIDEL